MGKIIDGYVKLFPELETLVSGIPPEHVPSATEETPRGAEAVRLILQDTPDRLWYVSELVEELKTRGWMPDSDNPANAVRTALERLVATETSDVHKKRYGNKVAYAYLPDGVRPGERPPAPIDSGPTYDYGEEPF